MKVNKQLIWDYDIPEQNYDTPAFREWYVARVLTQGTLQDIRQVGFDTIREMLPKLWLPAAIQYFWEWYFGMPHAHAERPDPYTFPSRAA